MSEFTIKDLENLSGIKAHTIRIWEQRYSFLKPKRTGTNIRYYNAAELKSILNIALLNKYGYRISHIDRMSPEEVRQKVNTLESTEAQQERIINELVQYMVDLDAEKFEETLNEYINEAGIDKTIRQIIFPFLHKVGVLWVTNYVTPAQEHIVINIIRQKLIVGIEKVEPLQVINKKVVLFLPEGEHHELGLLYVHYLLKAQGVQVIYLGANVPVKDMEFLVSLKKPDYLFTHLTAITGNFSFDKFIQLVHKRLPGIPLIVSGQMAQLYRKKLPSQVFLKRSVEAVTEFVSTFKN